MQHSSRVSYVERCKLASDWIAMDKRPDVSKGWLQECSGVQASFHWTGRGQEVRYIHVCAEVGCKNVNSS
jgi:hypothetical protein